MLGGHHGGQQQPTAAAKKLLTGAGLNLERLRDGEDVRGVGTVGDGNDVAVTVLDLGEEEVDKLVGGVDWLVVSKTVAKKWAL